MATTKAKIGITVCTKNLTLSFLRSITLLWYFSLVKAVTPLSFAKSPTILCASWYPISSEVYNSEVIECNSSLSQSISLYIFSNVTPKALYPSFLTQRFSVVRLKFRVVYVFWYLCSFFKCGTTCYMENKRPVYRYIFPDNRSFCSRLLFPAVQFILPFQQIFPLTVVC